MWEWLAYPAPICLPLLPRSGWSPRATNHLPPHPFLQPPCFPPFQLPPPRSRQDSGSAPFPPAVGCLLPLRESERVRPHDWPSARAEDVVGRCRCSGCCRAGRTPACSSPYLHPRLNPGLPAPSSFPSGSATLCSSSLSSLCSTSSIRSPLTPRISHKLPHGRALVLLGVDSHHRDRLGRTGLLQAS